LKSLKEKYGSWALVTGASSGIGKEFAKYFADEGFNLVLVARRIERLEELAKQLKEKNNIDVISVCADLSKDDFLSLVLEKIKDIEINILVNNAGIGSSGRFETIPTEKEIDLVKLNCLAPLILTHHFVKGMIKNKKGAIIFLGSIVAFQPNPFVSTYAASKSFNLMMGSGLWYELKKYNIDVLSVSPGGTRTEFLRTGKSNSGLIVDEPENVVRTAINALGKKPSIVHGIINKTMIKLSRLLPLKYSTRLAGFVARTINKVIMFA